MKPLISQLTDIIRVEPTVYGPKYRWQLSDLFDFTFYQKLGGRCIITLQHVFDEERILSIECNENEVIEQSKILVTAAMNTYQLELQHVQDIHKRFPQ